MDELFNSVFDKENLQKIYYEKMMDCHCTPGIDNINSKLFQSNIENNTVLVNKKICAGTYKFTKYKQQLILKGEGKPPRAICIATIRDRLAMRALNSYIREIYKNDVDTSLLHSKINDIKTNIQNYNSYIKLDIKRFYSSINHEKLMNQLKKKIDNELVLDLILKAITTCAVPVPFNSKNIKIERKKIGIPEGLSISNVLADIYLIDIDNYFINNKNIFYIRYVDDILLLCDYSNLEALKSEIKEMLSNLDLTVNEKADDGDISNSFTYLGYKFDGKVVSVRSSSIDKYEHSIEKLFINYKRLNNPELFLWKLNLKISGCVYNNRKYGWLFFYSQLTDEKLLHHLDWYVKHLMVRFGVKDIDESKIKKFVKSYYEINYNLQQSTYLINLNSYSNEDRVNIISKIYKKTVHNADDIFEVLKVFNEIVFKDIKDLEEDIQFFS